MRELRNMKQETLAAELGVTQQAISKIEQNEEVEDSTLEKIAKVLGVSAEIIKNFSEEAVINVISSTLNDNASINSNCSLNFNPIDKVLELYERLIASEREKIELLKREK